MGSITPASASHGVWWLPGGGDGWKRSYGSMPHPARDKVERHSCVRMDVLLLHAQRVMCGIQGFMHCLTLWPLQDGLNMSEHVSACLSSAGVCLRMSEEGCAVGCSDMPQCLGQMNLARRHRKHTKNILLFAPFIYSINTMPLGRFPAGD
jgi:hypothetical protein